MGRGVDKKRIMVWLIAILFVGSSVGMGILYTAGRNEVSLPQETILYKDLTRQQKSLAFSQYVTLIYFAEEKNCDSCYPIEEKLKQIALKYRPYVYLIILRDSNETYIGLDTGGGVERISSGSFDDIEFKICERAYFLPQCRDVRALRAVNGE